MTDAKYFGIGFGIAVAKGNQGPLKLNKGWSSQGQRHLSEDLRQVLAQ